MTQKTYFHYSRVIDIEWRERKNASVDFQELHPWDVSPSEAINIQKTLKNFIRLEPLTKEPLLVAGADISFNRNSPTVYAAFVVLDVENQRVVADSRAVVDVVFPYVPGLLSFREIPALIEAWKNLKLRPDVVILDGQGIAHPRSLGIATHMGLLINIPTIGCAKSLLVGNFSDLGPNKGDTTELFVFKRKVGLALRTKNKTKPVFISPGHLIDIEGSLHVVQKMMGKYRIPEPTRQAHLLVNQMRRGEA